MCRPMIPVTFGSARAMAEDEDEDNTTWESTSEENFAWLALRLAHVRQDVGAEMSLAGSPQRILRRL